MPSLPPSLSSDLPSSRRSFLKTSALTVAAPSSGGFATGRAAEPASSATGAPASWPAGAGGPPPAELRMFDGNPEIFVDCAMRSRALGQLSCPGEYAEDKIEQCLASDIGIYFTDVDFECSLGWDGEDRFDYAFYKKHLESIVEMKPDSLLILYVGCAGCAPYTWNKAHEDQLPLLSNGDRISVPNVGLITLYQCAAAVGTVVLTLIVTAFLFGRRERIPATSRA